MSSILVGEDIELDLNEIVFPGDVWPCSPWKKAGPRRRAVLPPPPDARVAHRVSCGGHDVPNSAIVRRFSKGWHDFENVYRGLVDHWKLYDNSGRTPVLLAEGGRQ